MKKRQDKGALWAPFFSITGLLFVLFLAGCKVAGDPSPQDAVPRAEEGNTKEMPVITVTQPQDAAFSSQDAAADPADPENGTEESLPDPETEFYITPITDEIFARMEGKSFKEDCLTPRDDLRYLHVLHKTLEGDTLEGELVVNVHIAEDVLAIFRELYEADYPIEKIRLVDEYNADDDLSMADNNTSCFNFRLVAHTNNISKHGRGLAIDLNPRYNPYIVTVNGELEITPENGKEYANRSGDFPYKIDENDLAYRLFTERGFAWGGAWKNEKDYQHFEIPSAKIREWYP